MTVNSKSELIFVKLLDPLRKAHHDTAMRLNTIGSMIPFVSAAGEVLLVVYCLKAKNGQTHSFSVDLQKRLEASNRTVAHILSFTRRPIPSTFIRFALRASPSIIIASRNLDSLMAIFGVRFWINLVRYGRSEV